MKNKYPQRNHFEMKAFERSLRPAYKQGPTHASLWNDGVR